MSLPTEYFLKQITEKIAETDSSGYTIQYPPMFLWEDIDRQKIIRGWKNIKGQSSHRVGLYVHIPYCSEKCTFCRYYSLGIKNVSLVGDYLSILKKEMELYRSIWPSVSFSSLYVGGGTPSLLTNEQLEDFFTSLYQCFRFKPRAQKVFEVNPASFDELKAKRLKHYGINRITIGIQSLTPSVLQNVGRLQTVADVERSITASKEAGIRTVNVDLMAGLPGESVEDFKKTVQRVIKMSPDMVHLHPFYPTALTPFMRDGRSLSREQVDLRTAMTHIGITMLRDAGYQNTPYDAMAKGVRHQNAQLADAVESASSFLGLGAGAVSHIFGHNRYVNYYNINQYREAVCSGNYPVQKGITTKKGDEEVYWITANLRYGFLYDKKFQALFGQPLEKRYGKTLKILQRLGKIQKVRGGYRSTMGGISGYLIYSKYFYDQKILARCVDQILPQSNQPLFIPADQFPYILL